MHINIDNFEHDIGFEDGQFAVHLDGTVFRANSIPVLIDDLKKSHREVILPDTIYTADLSVAEDLVKAGFKYLHVDKIFEGIHVADLKVSHWSPEASEKVDEWRKGQFRFYEARWTDENGEEQSQVYSEAELEGLRKVYRKPTNPSTGRSHEDLASSPSTQTEQSK